MLPGKTASGKYCGSGKDRECRVKIFQPGMTILFCLKLSNSLKNILTGNAKRFQSGLILMAPIFQKKVWEALLTIPYGETSTYGQIAKQIGDPKASQAVGAANGKNPIAIIAPCHRVIGSTGKMVGFGGGIENKILLLDLENPTVLPFR